MMGWASASAEWIAGCSMMHSLRTLPALLTRCRGTGWLVSLALALTLLPADGCTTADGWSERDPHGLQPERPMTVEIAVENRGATVGSIQLIVEYDAAQLEMHQLSSLLPEPMRLEYNAEHLGSGRFRLLCVPQPSQNEWSAASPPPRPGDAAEAPAIFRGIGTSFSIARLQFSARHPGVRPQLSAVAVKEYRAFGPLPEQRDVTNSVDIWLHGAHGQPPRD